MHTALLCTIVQLYIIIQYLILSGPYIGIGDDQNGPVMPVLVEAQSDRYSKCTIARRKASPHTAVYLGYTPLHDSSFA